MIIPTRPAVNSKISKPREPRLSFIHDVLKVTPCHLALMIRLYVLSLKLFNLLGLDVLVFFALCSREFTHRVKSVSMAKFTSQEVDSLQKGGNQVRQFGYMHSLWFASSCAYEIFHPFQRAREIFLKDWDMQLQRLPDSR